MNPRIITHDDVHKIFTPTQAVTALRQRLANGYDPAQSAPRTRMDMPYGQLLMMPASTGESFGIKVLSCADTQQRPDVPLIQGSYVLFNAQSLAPTHIIDGIALTDIRTSAVSIAGIYHLLTHKTEPLNTVIFGCGAQGMAHLRTLRSSLQDIRELKVTFISRNQPDFQEQWAQAGSTEADELLAKAELIICATTSSTPLFEANSIKDHAIVVAVGAHTVDARELPAELMSRATVLVEDIETALAECGDVVLAIEDGALESSQLVPIKDVLSEQVHISLERPVVFKTSGMGWEDLVLAQAIAEAYDAQYK